MPISTLSMAFHARQKIEEINAPKKLAPPPPQPAPAPRRVPPAAAAVTKSVDELDFSNEVATVAKSSYPRSISNMYMNFLNAKKCGSCGGFK